jgi:hypothetical protein
MEVNHVEIEQLYSEASVGAYRPEAVQSIVRLTLPNLAAVFAG